MKILESFKEYIQSNHLFLPKDKLLLAVSGGVDSVVLCELCQQAGFDFVIAHCNFQLRGAESERDEQFVKELAIKYGKEVLVKRFDTSTYASEKKISIQVAARELRYGWFNEIVKRETGNGKRETSNFQHQTPNFILTAHHADDNIETILMNFFKGTGIAGLRGMLPKQGNIIRPLLLFQKTVLQKFAKENHLSWVEDSSNESDQYTRNYFRRQVIPLIEKIYPETINNVTGNAERFRDIETLYYQAIDQHKKKLLEKKGNEIHIPVLKLKKSEPLATIVYEIVKEYDFSPAQVPEALHLLESESGKYIQSSTHRIIKNRQWLIIAPLNTAEAENILIEENTENVQCSMFNIQFSKVITKNYKPETINSIASVDADLVHFPLLLRKWKQGDYFYPLGMKKKKKLSRFFIDQKLSKTDKENVWVLEMNKKIIWVIGHRIDERFKITDNSKEVLKIALERQKVLA